MSEPDRESVAIKEAEFENIYVDCPYCHKEIIYNRITDLGSTRFTRDEISGMQIDCLECKHPIWIYSDCINPVYQKLFFESNRLRIKKQYRLIILNLCQAAEVFLHYVLMVKLLYEPLSKKIIDCKQFNGFATELGREIEKLTYMPMRNIAMNMLLCDTQISRIDEIKAILRKAVKLKGEPSDKAIQRMKTARKSQLLVKLKDWDINDVRNRVAHKFAYRPHLSEVDKLLGEFKEIVFGIESEFNIKYPNAYMN